MKADSIRRVFQPVAEIHPARALFALFAFAGIVALSLVASHGGGEAAWAIAGLLAIIAMASLVGALASAGVRFDRLLPLPRTALLSLLFFASLLAALAVAILPRLDHVLSRGHPYHGAFYAGYQATLVDEGHVGTFTWQLVRPIDAAVAQWVRDEAEIRSSTLEGWLLARPWYRRKFGVETGHLRALAEKRLKLFSGDAPGWAPTARLCEEDASRHNGTPFKWDYNRLVERDARNYSQLLGREVKPAELLPRVPNGRCE